MTSEDGAKQADEQEPDARALASSDPIIKHQETARPIASEEDTSELEPAEVEILEASEATRDDVNERPLSGIRAVPESEVLAAEARDDLELLVRAVQEPRTEQTAHASRSEAQVESFASIRTLPSAKVGLPYRHELKVGDFDSLTVIPPVQDLGFRVDLDNGLLTGLPEVPGQFSIDIVGLRGSQRLIVTLVVDIVGPSRVPPEPQLKNHHLPNAQVGVEYMQELALDSYESLALVGEVGIPGFAIELDKGLISGLPETAGQFSVELTGLQGATPVVVTLILDVIADPKSLWKNIPSNPEAPFWKREESAEVSHGHLRMAAASKRGRSHAHEGSFRDDDFALSQTRPDGWYVACVADGAGSSRFSRRASQLVTEFIARKLGPVLEASQSLSEDKVETAVDLMRTSPGDAVAAVKTWAYTPLILEGAQAAAAALKEEGTLIQCEPSDLYTTLLVAAAKRCGEDYLVISFGLGDGGLAIWNPESRTVTNLFSPEGGEFAGQTTFLKLNEFQDQEMNLARLGVGIMPKGAYTFLMTDGITDPFFPTERDLEDPAAWSAFWDDDFGQVLDFSKERDILAQELLSWMDFWAKSNHDDRTIAVMHNPETT